MKQMVHIFAKDTRHLWMEIAVSLALIAALVISFPLQWVTHMGSDFAVSFSPRGSLALVPSLLPFLVPLSWWVLISPVIHEERLVGDRQFWLTRPYEWKSLLAAKILFVIVFVVLPLLIAQCVMLLVAGFNPLSYFPGLLFNLLLIASLLLLPLFALAAVTRNFARMTLVLLGVLLCIVAISWLASQFPGAHIATPFGDWVSLVVLACGCIAMVTVQYAQRRNIVAWLLLSATLLVVAALACAAPDQAAMSRSYPVAPGSGSGIVLSYENDAAGGPVASVAGPKDVTIWIPIHISGIPEGRMAIPQYLKVTLDAPDGSHWTSMWQPVYLDNFLPGGRTTHVTFAIPRSLYERLKPLPLRVHLDLALEQGRASGTSTISMPLDEFRIPGFATCAPLTGEPDQIGEIFCRTALRQPPLTLVQAVWAYSDCRLPSQERRNVQGAGWVGSLDRPPADFGIVPLWRNPIPFETNENEARMNEPRHICPGTPATFSTYLPAGRMQTGLDIQGFVLPELSRGQIRLMQTN